MFRGVVRQGLNAKWFPSLEDSQSSSFFFLEACAVGILTQREVDHCMSVTTNRILCGVELAIGVLVMILMLREIKRVSSVLRAMLLCYSALLVCIMIVCVISLAGGDPTLEATYVLTSLGHTAFAFGVSCRTLVLARVSYFLRVFWLFV